MAIISALPNTIANGQTADATPLTANFNHVVNQVNANAADATLVPLLAAANSFTAVQSGLAATAAANFPIVTQIQDSVFLTLTSTLGTNTITARSRLLPLGALANGQIFTFVPSQTNTGPVTLNPDALGNTAIFIGGTNVMSGQIIKDVPLAVRYESPRFHVIGGPNPIASPVGIAVGGAAPGAGGVAFPATAVAVADANTLDDYEEGTWDATVTSSVGSITTNTAANAMDYTKIGRAVTICGQVTVSSVSTPSGNLTITGLPFTNQAGSENSGRAAVSLSCGTLETTAATEMTGYIIESTTAISIVHFAAGAQGAAAADVKAGSTFVVNATYFI